MRCKTTLAVASTVIFSAGLCGCHRTPSAPANSADAPASTAPVTSAAVTATAPAMPLDNQFTVYCSGAACGASNASTYSGSGVGVWRYNNTTDSPASLNVDVKGAQEGQTAVLVFSNGESTPTSAPSIPSELTQATNLHVRSAPKHILNTIAKLRDLAHGKLLERNLRRAKALIAARKPIAMNASEPFASIGPVLPQDPPILGTKKIWYDTFSKTSPYQTAASASCKLPGGRNAVFWVDAKASFASAALARFKDTFCGDHGGYARVKEQLGDVWGLNTRANADSLISDYPHFQDINIVFLNVPNTTKWGGYFDSGNNFIKPDQGAVTNRALVFFINAAGALADASYYLSTLLHELTHMVNFYQRAVSSGVTHDTWLEETSAMMTEDIIVPAVMENGYSIIPDDRVGPYLATGGAVSLINWPQLSDPHYDMGGSFGAFLDRRYGTRIYQGLIRCDGKAAPPSYGCLDKLIHDAGGSGFADESARFAATIFAALPADGVPVSFGYTKLQSGAYALAPIDVSRFVDQRPQPPAALGKEFAATSHTYYATTIGPGQSEFVGSGIVVPPHSAMLLIIK